MKFDLEELRKLAEAATPGPWYLGLKIDGVNSSWGSQLPEGSCQIWSDQCISALGCIAGATPYPPNAAFIAAANPETVLALLDVVEAAKELLTQDEGWYEWKPLQDALARLEGKEQG